MRYSGLGNLMIFKQKFNKCSQTINTYLNHLESVTVFLNIITYYLAYGQEDERGGEQL